MSVTEETTTDETAEDLQPVPVEQMVYGIETLIGRHRAELQAAHADFRRRVAAETSRVLGSVRAEAVAHIAEVAETLDQPLPPGLREALERAEAGAGPGERPMVIIVPWTPVGGGDTTPKAYALINVTDEVFS